MTFNLEKIEDRKRLIEQINGYENRKRKEESFKQNEIFQDRATKYVYDYLRGQFSNDTVNEMPVISTINLAKRIVQQQASLYKNKPNRMFTDLSDEQEEVVKDIYNKMYVDSQLNKSNEYFKLQNHNILQILPKKGVLKMRVLRPDQIDVVPDSMHPEDAMIYIISAYDRSWESTRDIDKRNNNPTGNSVNSTYGVTPDSINQDIADPDDWQGARFFTVWTPELNFVMDIKGAIVSGDDIINPIAPMLPFVDIAENRDFEYWVRVAQSITDFTIQYNGVLSDMASVIRMQGFAQAVISGPSDLIPETLKIGHNTVIRLPIDPNNPIPAKFEFVSPNPDLSGSISYLEFLLANFLSSRGVDPKTISGKADATKFTSGVERLLSMIEKFEATKTDISTYEEVEREIYNLIKVWHNTMKGTGTLLPSIETADLSEDSEIIVTHQKPEMIKTDAETLADIQVKLDLSLMSKVEAIMELRNLDNEEEAKEILEKIEEEDFGNTKTGFEQTGESDIEAEPFGDIPDEGTE